MKYTFVSQYTFFFQRQVQRFHPIISNKYDQEDQTKIKQRYVFYMAVQYRILGYSGVLKIVLKSRFGCHG
jgi:hypothetical protein